MERNNIEFIARAVVVCDGKILLCQSKGKSNYFFPGGHVEFDEDIVTALKREIKEEVDVDVLSTQFIGLWENQFMQEGVQKHEINIMFEAKLGSSDIKNMEDHIESKWMPLVEFKDEKVLPVLLKEKVLQWMEDKQVFFGSERGDTKLV